MAWKIVEDMEVADELWRAGILYFQSRRDVALDDWWSLDESNDSPLCAPSLYFPSEYIYAIQVEV